METQTSIQRCIYVRLAGLLTVASVCIALATLYPPVTGAVSTPAFERGMLMLCILGLVLLVVGRSTLTQQRVTFGVVFAAFTGLMVLMSARTTKGVVLFSLAAALVLVCGAAALGAHVGGASLDKWTAPLLGTLTVLLVLSLTNLLVLQSTVLETAVSAACIALFTGLTVYDVASFSAGRGCIHDCCEEGAFSTFLNFGNLFTNIASVSG